MGGQFGYELIVTHTSTKTNFIFHMANECAVTYETKTISLRSQSTPSSAYEQTVTV